jgi:dynein heavy chain, axonemal
MLSFSNWDKRLEEFEFSRDQQFFDILVPTLDTVKYTYIMKLLLQAGKPVFIAGVSGVGKTLLIEKLLGEMKNNKFTTISLNFSAQTSSSQTQSVVEGKLYKKTKTLFGAKPGERQCQ